MSIRKVVFAALVPMLFAATSAYAADTSIQHGQPSLFSQYSVAAVQPYYAPESTGYDTYPVLHGAQVYVRAREGLTAEWLELSLQKALAQHTSSGPAVANLKVDVVSAGAGFWVTLRTDDVRSAKTVLNWARSISAEQPVVSVK